MRSTTTKGETKCDDFLLSWQHFLPRRAFFAWQRQQAPRRIQSAWPAVLPMQSSAITRTLRNARLPHLAAWAIASQTLNTAPMRTRAIAALVSAFANRQESSRLGGADSCHCTRRDSMIANYTNHAANERTFLAWIRTGLAVAAFGFFLIKLNVFADAIGGGSIPHL